MYPITAHLKKIHYTPICTMVFLRHYDKITWNFTANQSLLHEDVAGLTRSEYYHIYHNIRLGPVIKLNVGSQECGFRNNSCCVPVMEAYFPMGRLKLKEIVSWLLEMAVLFGLKENVAYICINLDKLCLIKIIFIVFDYISISMVL